MLRQPLAVEPLRPGNAADESPHHSLAGDIHPSAPAAADIGAISDAGISQSASVRSDQDRRDPVVPDPEPGPGQSGQPDFARTRMRGAGAACCMLQSPACSPSRGLMRGRLAVGACWSARQAAFATACLAERAGFGAPGGTRTPDHQVRSLVLYPAELPARGAAASVTAGRRPVPEGPHRIRRGPALAAQRRRAAPAGRMMAARPSASRRSAGGSSGKCRASAWLR